MRRMLTLLAVAAIAAGCGGRAAAISLWTAESQSLVADRQAHRVGDIVTVLVVEKSLTSHQASHETEKELKASGGPGGGILNLFPELSVETDRSTSGKGTASQATRLVDRISARVTEVTPEGNLRIEGERSIRLNRDELTLAVSGLVRPDDISPDNTVLSTRIADCRMKWAGSGPIPEKQRPGLLSALLSLLW